jgi:hypothetical protein
MTGTAEEVSGQKGEKKQSKKFNRTRGETKRKMIGKRGE